MTDSVAASRLRQARQLCRRGADYHRVGRHRDAEAAYRASCARFRQALPPDSLELVDATAAHAETLHQLGDQRAALAVAAHAYAAVKRIRGDHARRLRVKLLAIEGNVHRANGDYRLAGPVLRRALTIARELGRDSADAATAMNCLGILYKYTGQFARAETLYRESLRIALRIHGKAHSEIATLYHNLGGLAFSRQRYEPAVRWGRAALALRTRLFGAGNVLVAADAAALAASLDGLGRHAEAQRLYRRALATFRRHHGNRHYDVAVNLNNLGASLYAQGKLAVAAGYYRIALALKKQLLGAAHIDVALTANNLGILYAKQRRHRAARKLVDQARKVLVGALGPRHPKSRAVIANWQALRDRAA